MILIDIKLMLNELSDMLPGLIVKNQPDAALEQLLIFKNEFQMNTEFFLNGDFNFENFPADPSEHWIKTYENF